MTILREVEYDCEKSLKGEDEQKGSKGREGCGVFYTLDILTALDEWTSLKEQRLLTGNA